MDVPFLVLCAANLKSILSVEFTIMGSCVRAARVEIAARKKSRRSVAGAAVSVPPAGVSGWWRQHFI